MYMYVYILWHFTYKDSNVSFPKTGNRLKKLKKLGVFHR